jgi:hypothetical protein
MLTAKRRYEMKRATVVLGLVAFALAATPIYAQQPVAPSDPHHPGTQAAPAPANPPGPPSGGSGMMPMEMCRQMMMGGNMMGGMMGTPPGAHAQPMDPKMMGQMMEMHGEMMKAMGDIMMKHARKMQSIPR